LSRFAAKPCRSATRGLLSSQIQLLLAHKRAKPPDYARTTLARVMGFRDETKVAKLRYGNCLSMLDS